MKQLAELGDEVEDIVTGFKGIVVCISSWLNGCRRVTIQPQTLHDGKPIESNTFDIEQLEVKTKSKVNLKKEPTGGPTPGPVQRPNVTR